MDKKESIDQRDKLTQELIAQGHDYQQARFMAMTAKATATGLLADQPVEESTTIADFFGDGSVDNVPECLYCGGTGGILIVSISDHNGPTHWHHEYCRDKRQRDENVKVALERLNNDQATNDDFDLLARSGYGYIEDDEFGPAKFIYSPGDGNPYKNQVDY